MAWLGTQVRDRSPATALPGEGERSVHGGRDVIAGHRDAARVRILSGWAGHEGTRLCFVPSFFFPRRRGRSAPQPPLSCA